MIGLDFSRRLIFVHGLSQRTGTTYLRGLLRLHPDCKASPIHEDYLVHNAHLLESFVSSVTNRWTDWSSPEELWLALGEGFGRLLAKNIEAIREDNARKIVSKTPSVDGLTKLPLLFPHSKALIIVRDGRDMTASGMKSFGWSLEASARKWVDAVGRVNEFRRSCASYQYKVVKYETLFTDTVATLKDILSFVDLDVETYDYKAALNFPVKGSSDFGRKEGEAVHWNEVKKTSDFSPLGRWKNWTVEQQHKFMEIAGNELRALGYTE